LTPRTTTTVGAFGGSNRMPRLAGKIAVVTAAGSGIGRATALAFALEGAQVVAVDVDAGAASATAASSTAGSGPGVGSIHTHAADVSRSSEVAGLFAHVGSEFGRLHVLFNGVGISGRRFGDGPVGECTEEGWDHVLSVNLKSVYLCCHHALPLMTAGGSIIHVGSVLGSVGGGTEFATHAYAASKGGLIALSRSMATYYAKQGIRVNVIAPGLIATPMSQRAQSDAELMGHVARMQPLAPDPAAPDRHLGRPEDVAAAAVYLASDDAAFVTGIVLPVDGGWTAH
jgi:NAD(P)-dependent dehydrogenase (short-subunit alcohol dehydrogenase family)